jgi:ABC-2 type transport system permease protein
MHPILILLLKDLRTFIRYKASLVITFAVPVILIWLFGFVFGLNKKDTGPSGITLAVVNLSPEPAAAALIESLKAEKGFSVITEETDSQGVKHPLTEARVREAIRDNRYRFALIIPADLMSDERLGLRLGFLQNPRNEIETQVVNGLLQKTLFTQVPELFGQSLQRRARKLVGEQSLNDFNRNLANSTADTFGGDRNQIYESISKGNFFGSAAPSRQAPAEPALRKLDADPQAQAASPTAATSTQDLLSQLLKIETEQVVGKKVKNPMAARLIGGYAVMFLLFAVSGFSTSFFGEKSSGIFQRILASSATRSHILISKFLFCILLGLFQLSALFLFGNLLYHIDLGQHLVPLFAVMLGASAACASFGMLVASLSPNAQAANGLATLLVLTMSSIGGAWFPVTFMPDFIQKLAKLTVVYWSVEGLTNIFWADYSLLQSLPVVGVLLLMTLLCLAVSLWRFHKSNLFD